MPTYSTLGEEKVKSADVASGKGGKVFALGSGDVNLVAQSPNGNSMPRIITVLVAGIIAGTNDNDAVLSIPAVFTPGQHVPYVFKTFTSATSTATVLVGW